MIDSDWTWNELEDYATNVEAERDRYREALERIERDCGDDAEPEDNAVRIAREALRTTESAP